MAEIAQHEIEQAKSVDLVALIGRHVNLEKRCRDFFGLCPFHKEKTPSFKVSPTRGRYHCFGCGADGDAIDWLREVDHIGFGDAVQHLVGDVQHRRLHIAVRTDKPRDLMTDPKVREARAIWSSAKPAVGTLIETYFAARMLPIPAPVTIRFVPHCPWDRSGYMIFPAMICAVQDPSGKVIGVEATALAPDGKRKAFADSRRKTGVMAAGAVRLASAGEVLGLAEGVETALAAMDATGVPTWSSLGATRMHSVAVADCVRELHIFADDDEAGARAAEKTVAAHPRLKRIVRLPPRPFTDWNDFTMAQAKVKS